MFTGVQRSKNILSRIRALMGQMDDAEDNNDMIFALATAKMIDIAETIMCVESSMTLAVVANTASYDLTLDGSSNATGFFRKKLLAPPLSSLITIEELDINDFDNLQRYAGTSPGLPTWYIKIFAGTLTFYPTPTATQSWTLYFYKSPTTTISKTVAPETPSSFDSAICACVASQLWAQKGAKAQVEAMEMLYDNEFARGIQSWRARKTAPMFVTYEDY